MPPLDFLFDYDIRWFEREKECQKTILVITNNKMMKNFIDKVGKCIRNDIFYFDEELGVSKNIVGGSSMNAC